MSYAGISIREAMEKINHKNNGWYLPQVQRQYVWGTRYESETYICLLLDSLYKRYPVGGLVLWETDRPVPFREFLRDYRPGEFARQAEEGRWGGHKSLVYDGQQRLQTLHSALYYTFNGKVLCFNLLFDKDKAESDETGFSFLDRGKPTPPHWIEMNEVSSRTCDAKVKITLETKYTKDKSLNDEQEILVESNISVLWDVFVDKNVKSIAYFLVTSDDEEVVNEVFRRLNTGGVTLTQIELVLSKIKARHSDYEEHLWGITEQIHGVTDGFTFTSAEILQFFYLLIFGTTKVQESRVREQDVESFKTALTQSAPALREFFEGYLWGQLRINNASIVMQRQAMLPLAIYLASRKDAGNAYHIKNMSGSNLRAIHQYFILSQFCGWNTQTMVNAFADKAKDAGQAGLEFPLDSIKQIAVQKNRSDILEYHQFVLQPWLALKILANNRQYVFYDSKPQVDHIFPLNLKGKDDEYKARVDVLWNLQPMPAGINNYKRARDPKEFFGSDDGAKYFQDYDFMPEIDSASWVDERTFIWSRHRKMRKALLTKYGIKLKRLRLKKPK